MAGRKAKPAHLIIVEGNKGGISKDDLEKRLAAEEKLNTNFKSDSIKAPTWLNDEGKKVFRKLVKEFDGTGLLKNVDTYMIAMFADAYVLYIMCTEEINREGLMVEYTNKGAETNKVPHPLLTKKSQAFQQMKTLMAEFGLSPSARAKLVKDLEADKEPTEEDRMFGDV